LSAIPRYDGGKGDLLMTKRTNRVARGLAVAAVLLGSGALIPAWAADTYAVQQHPLGPDRTLIRVYNSRTGKTIWTRQTRDPRLIRWSADRTALAVLDERLGEDGQEPDWYDLLVWRSGERVRTIRFLPPFRRFELVRALTWSPDKKRLLLLGPYSQGDADQGFNALWCVRLQDDRTQLVSDAVVTRADWIGTARVRYWTGELVPDPAKPNRGILRETPHEQECR
jgi:hypothetical protein